MNIIIHSKDYRGSLVFPVIAVAYQLDENQKPIDIVIYGEEEVLKSLCEFVIIGFNMQPTEDWRMMAQGATHECLIGRLEDFSVEAKKVTFE